MKKLLIAGKVLLVVAFLLSLASLALGVLLVAKGDLTRGWVSVGVGVFCLIINTISATTLFGDRS